MSRRVLAWVIGALVALSATSVSARPIAFRLDVTPTSGRVGDTFVATVTLELAATGGYDQYAVPSARDFLIKDTQIARTQSVGYTAAGGRTFKSVETRRYVMEAKRPGRLAVGPATLVIGGRTYRTGQVTVTVAASGGSPSASARHADPTAGGVGVPGFYPPDPATRSELFLHVVLDKSEVYLGEQATVTWLLYTQTDVLNFKPQPPRLDNLWPEKLYEPNKYFRYHQARVGGVPYEVAIVSKRALFPTKSGVLEIPPYTADVTTIHTPIGSVTPVASKSAWLRVRALPAKAPAGFDDTYVGRFQVSAEVERSRLKAGDSLTLTLTVRGTGAIRRTAAPRIDVPGFRFRAPRDFDETVDTSTNVVRGTRTYRYWASPQRGGAQTLPPIRIPYFDPSSGRYEVAETKPISIVVNGDPSVLLGGGPVGAGVMSSELRPALTPTILTPRSPKRLHDSFWFWGAALLPMLGFVGFVVTQRLRARTGRTRPRSAKRAAPRVRKRLRRADRVARDGDSQALYTLLADVLYDQLEARVGGGVRALKRDELANHLRERGYERAIAEALVAEFDQLDAARFSPAEVSADEMQSAIGRARALSRKVDSASLPRDSVEYEA